MLAAQHKGALMMVAVLLTSIMSSAEAPQAELQLGMSVFVWTRDPLFHSRTVKVSSGARPLVLTLIKMATRLMRRVASAEGCREGFNKPNINTLQMERQLHLGWGVSFNTYGIIQLIKLIIIKTITARQSNIVTIRLLLNAGIGCTLQP